MSDELKPCPFCGDKPIELATSDGGGELYCVYCSFTWIKPWDNWNSRVDDAKLKLAVEALEVYAYGSFACRCNYGDAHLGEPCRLDAYIRENGETIARDALKQIGE